MTSLISDARSSTQDDTSGLRSLFLREGQPLEAGISGMLPLNAGDTCWYLKKGSADIFAVTLDEDGKPISVPSYVVSLQTGALLFGLDPSSEGSLTAFSVRGDRDSELVALPLEKLLSEIGLAAERVKAIDRWVNALTGAVAQKSARKPALGGSLSPRSGVSAVPSHCYTVEGEVLWLRGPLEFSYCNGQELALDDRFFPLGYAAWVQPVVPSELTTVRTLECLAAGKLQPSLEGFHRYCLAALIINSARRQNRTLEQRSRRDLKNEDLIGNALEQSLEVNRQRRRSGAVSSDDALLRAVTFLAARLGAEAPQSPVGQEDTNESAMAESLLESAGLASREVALRDRWWRSTGLAIIAWTEEGRPIALWSATRKGYHAFDPVTGQQCPVDAKFAEALTGRAYSVHPTLLGAKATFWDVLKKGLSGGKRDVIALLCFGALGALISLITPSVTAVLINTAIPQSAQGLVVELAGVLVSVAIVVALFQFLQATAMLRAETLFEMQAQSALWQRLMRLPSSFFRRFNSGDLAFRALGLSQMRTVLSQGFVAAVLGGLFSLFNFIVMIAYGGSLTLWALLMTLVTLLVAVTINIAKMRRLRRAIALHDALAGLSTQGIAAINKLRVAGAERRFAAKMITLHNQRRIHEYGARTLETYLRAFNTVIPLASTAVFFAVVGFLLEKPLVIGDFVAFSAAYGSFIVGVTGMLNSLPLGLVALVLFERMKPILEAEPETYSNGADPGTLSGRIELNRVTFSYGSSAPPVLQDVSLTIEPGQFVAIVGPSGSGKSTLLRLLLGFDLPQSGSILLDDKDLSQSDIRAARRQFGAVLQNAQLLGGSIYDNIAGSRPISLEEAWDAAAKVGLNQTIRAMPMQMNTIVNEGTTISGGERQRLMLARALAGGPSILLMDEATSALDNATQALVAQSLAQLDLTRIVVAHRFSTIKDADRIFVLHNGKIVESGTAESLIAEGGLFASLAEGQDGSSIGVPA